MKNGLMIIGVIVIAIGGWFLLNHQTAVPFPPKGFYHMTVAEQTQASKAFIEKIEAKKTPLTAQEKEEINMAKYHLGIQQVGIMSGDQHITQSSSTSF